MSGTKNGYTKREQTLIAKYGSLEAYKAKLREWASQGGTKNPTFANDRELAKRAGKKGHAAYVEKIKKGEAR